MLEQQRALEAKVSELEEQIAYYSHEAQQSEEIFKEQEIANMCALLL